MCDECWTGNGSPTIWNPAVAEVVEMVDRLYSGGWDGFDQITGGPLHVVVDDWNLDGPITPYWSGDETPELVAHVNLLAEKLRALSLDERYSAMAHHDGFAKEGVPVAPGA